MYLITFDSHYPPSTPCEYFSHPISNSSFLKTTHNPICAACIHMGVSFLLEHGQPTRNYTPSGPKLSIALKLGLQLVCPSPIHGGRLTGLILCKQSQLPQIHGCNVHVQNSFILVVSHLWLLESLVFPLSLCSLSLGEEEMAHLWLSAPHMLVFVL